MYSRRALLRAAGGATLGGLLIGCRADRTQSSTTDSTTGSSTAPSPSAPPSTSASPPTVPPDAPWASAEFDELDEFLAVTNSEAFAIVEGGVTVHQWYRTDEAYARDIASAQKSVLSLLVGRAIGDGIIGIDTLVDDVLGTGWTPHGQTSGITVRHLLTMTSGLDDGLAVVTPPGTGWLYSGAFAQLFAVLEVTTGRDVDDLANEWLFDVARADTAVFYERRTDEAAPIGMRATVKDLVAIGQVVLDASQPGLPAGWLDESLAPSQPFNHSYGYLWWLNGQDSFMLPGPAPRARSGSLIPTAPADLVAALGKADQKLYISQELGLVVARLGEKADPESRPALSTFDASLWEMLARLRTGTG